MSAVADIEFFWPIDLAERAAKWRVVEKRIVTEATGSARGEKNFAFHFAAECLADLSCFGERDHADKSRAAISIATQTPEQEFVVCQVGCVGACIAR